MAEASTIIAVAAVVGVAAALAGAGVATYSAVHQAQESEKQARNLKHRREREALLAEQNAEIAASQHQRRMRLLAGEQQSTLAAAGLSTTSGTPLVFDIDLATQGELETLLLKRQGALASEEKMFEAGILGQRERSLRGSIVPTVAGGTLSGIAGAASIGSSAALAYKPTTTSVK